jgi:uncharacterized membrane-anchored protein
MLKGNRWLIILNLALFAGWLGFSVGRNEKILTHGRLVYLELTPNDPRSIIQGDYMRLTYKIADLPHDQLAKLPATGYCVLTLDNQNIGRLKRFQQQRTPVDVNEIVIPFHNNRRYLSIGAESYFFEEGKAAVYEPARFGRLRVGNDGTTLLTGLSDEHLKPL